MMGVTAMIFRPGVVIYNDACMTEAWRTMTVGDDSDDARDDGFIFYSKSQLHC